MADIIRKTESSAMVAMGVVRDRTTCDGSLLPDSLVHLLRHDATESEHKNFNTCDLEDGGLRA